ncbi:hypothetical protein SMAC4_13856 [Sordaria macrospora]|uniref:uncharacterized protein n=1 Tax=Sordaria macrospora TaxID=5147 RepID=UPI002B28CEC1|nr:hypothetical protein SMAC4_13856 [Sordaria macrospora]
MLATTRCGRLDRAKAAINGKPRDESFFKKFKISRCVRRERTNQRVSGFKLLKLGARR